MECTHLKPTKLPSILACIVATFLKLLFTVWELRPYRIIELTSSCCNIWYNCEITIRESLMPIIATALQNYLCASLIGTKLGELYNVKLQLCGTTTYRKQIKCCSSYR